MKGHEKVKVNGVQESKKGILGGEKGQGGKSLHDIIELDTRFKSLCLDFHSFFFSIPIAASQ